MHVYNSQAVMVDQTLYISGIIGLDPKTLNLVSGGVEAEAEQVFLWFILHNILLLIPW